MTGSEFLIMQHEGLRLDVYNCPEGFPTIGYGHNLAASGRRLTKITKTEAEELFKEDMAAVYAELEKPPFNAFYRGLCGARRAVLENMMFNLGPGRLLMFKKLIKAMETADYNAAACEMINSKWAGQVGYRAVTLANMMRSGKFAAGAYVDKEVDNV